MITISGETNNGRRFFLNDLRAVRIHFFPLSTAVCRHCWFLLNSVCRCVRTPFSCHFFLSAIAHKFRATIVPVIYIRNLKASGKIASRVVKLPLAEKKIKARKYVFHTESVANLSRQRSALMPPFKYKSVIKHLRRENQSSEVQFSGEINLIPAISRIKCTLPGIEISPQEPTQL